MSREPNELDHRVATRIRLRRQVIKMSQAQLGTRIGVTFQQIQKYEQGRNRVGAGRLLQIAEALNVPVSYFFEDVASSRTFDRESNFPGGILDQKDIVELLTAFSQISSPKIRHQLVEFVRAIASEASRGDLSEVQDAQPLGGRR
ncbi:MAG TPA: helix-turn-helix transcriptional regulator [Microvirga sp.]|nr:helix-turn-helix transcriptional regulator [Microvirga sp.]